MLIILSPHKIPFANVSQWKKKKTRNCVKHTELRHERTPLTSIRPHSLSPHHRLLTPKRVFLFFFLIWQPKLTGKMGIRVKMFIADIEKLFGAHLIA